MTLDESGNGARSGAADSERAFERLAEDETLRGDLTDAGYGPLLSWAAALAIARAARFASTDALYLALRALLAGAVAAAQERTLAPLLAAAAPPLLTPAEAKALRKSPPALSADPDDSAAAITRHLAALTGLDRSP